MLFYLQAVFVLLGLVRGGAACNGTETEGFCIQLFSNAGLKTFNQTREFCESLGLSMVAPYNYRMFTAFNDFVEEMYRQTKILPYDTSAEAGVFLASYTTSGANIDQMVWNAGFGPAPQFKIGDMYIPEELTHMNELGSCLAIAVNYSSVLKTFMFPTQIRRTDCSNTYNVLCMSPINYTIPGIWNTPHNQSYDVNYCAAYEVIPGLDYAPTLIDTFDTAAVADVSACGNICRTTPYCYSFVYYSDTLICRVFGTSLTDRAEQEWPILANAAAYYGEMNYRY